MNFQTFHGNVYEIEFEAQLQGVGAGMPMAKIVGYSIADAISTAEKLWPGAIIVSAKLALAGVTYGFQLPA